MRRAAAALAVLMLAGCTLNSNATQEGPMTTIDAGEVVWDFRRPLTTLDLGSDLDDLMELDGPVELDVIFPSGREVTGNWARGALAIPEGGANLGGEPAQPVNQVDLLDDEVDSVAEVRASAERFINEFGPATRGSDGMSLPDYLDEFEAIVDAAAGGKITPRGHGTSEGGLGSTIRAFVAEEQDGITPGLMIRVVDGGVTLRTSITFVPAADA